MSSDKVIEAGATETLTNNTDTQLSGSQDASQGDKSADTGMLYAMSDLAFQAYAAIPPGLLDVMLYGGLSAYVGYYASDPSQRFGLLSSRSKDAMGLVFQKNDPSIDDLVKASYGKEWPKGLDIAPDAEINTQKVRIAPKHFTISSGETLLSGPRILNYNPYLSGLIPGFAFGSSNISNILGHETTHILQSEYALLHREFKKKGVWADADLTRGAARLGFESFDLGELPSVRFTGEGFSDPTARPGTSSAPVTHYSANADQLMSMVTAGTGRFNDRYLGQGIEMQARMHEVMSFGYQTWGRLPGNKIEFLLAMESLGFEVPDASKSAALALNPEAREDAFIRPSYLRTRAAREMGGVISNIPEAERAVLWDTVMPAMYADLIEMYGDKEGRARFGFGENPRPKMREQIEAFKNSQTLPDGSPNFNKMSGEELQALRTGDVAANVNDLISANSAQDPLRLTVAPEFELPPQPKMITGIGAAGVGLGLLGLYGKTGPNGSIYEDRLNPEVENYAYTSLGMDVSAVTLDSLFLAQQSGKFFQGTGAVSKALPFAGPVGVGLAVGSTTIDYTIAKDVEDGARGASAVGGGVGALGVMGLCALVGAKYGVLGGPYGIAIGGIGGALAGGLGGSYFFADEMQEYFDEEGLADQRENLKQLTAIQERFGKLQTLEGDFLSAQRRLKFALENGPSGDLESAQEEFNATRIALADAAPNTLLTDKDREVLESVYGFIKQEAQMLSLKRPKLQAQNNTEALTRLDARFAELSNAMDGIRLLQNMDHSYAEAMGADEKTAAQRAQETVAEINTYIPLRIDELRKIEAAQDQREFNRDLAHTVGEAASIITYNPVNDRLAAVVEEVQVKVISGDADEASYRGLVEGQAALKTSHERALAGITTAREQIQYILAGQMEQVDDHYAGQYVGQNHDTLRQIIGRMDEEIASYQQTANAYDLVVEKAKPFAALDSVISHRPQSDASLTQNIARDAQEINVLLSEDILDIQKIADTERNLHMHHIHLRETIDLMKAYEQRLREALDTGVDFDGERVKISDPHLRERLQNSLEATQNDIRTYSRDAQIIEQKIEVAEGVRNSRYLEAGPGSYVYMDTQGRIAAYTENNKHHSFAEGGRPLLRDDKNSVYTDMTGLKQSGVILHLYDGASITPIVQGQVIEPAVPPEPAPDPVKIDQVMGNGSSKNTSEVTTMAADLITDNPDYISIAIILEDLNRVGSLDITDESIVTNRINDPNLDPEIKAALIAQYGTLLTPFIQTDDSAGSDTFSIDKGTLPSQVTSFGGM